MGSSFGETLLLSGTSAIASKTMAAPIERVKLILQSQGEMLKQGRINQGYNGITDCFSKIFRNEGIAAFWRGNFANCLRYFPNQELFISLFILQ